MLDRTVMQTPHKLEASAQQYDYNTTSVHVSNIQHCLELAISLSVQD